MDKAALLGHPVKHSLSPQIFAALSKLLDRDVKYKAVDVEAASDFEGAVEKLCKEEYSGFNVTIPYKRAGKLFAGSVTGEARAVGAVNCVKIEKASLKATNTDALGFYDALSEAGFKPREARTNLLGAGGAARAVAYALGRAGARNVNIWSRKNSNAEGLAKEMSDLWPDTAYSAGPVGPAELWINATPMGMEKIPEKFPMKKLEGAILAYDLVYGRPTKFLELGAAARARCLTGVPMLVFQAIRAWEFWFGSVGGQGRNQLKTDLMRLKKWR